MQPLVRQCRSRVCGHAPDQGRVVALGGCACRRLWVSQHPCLISSLAVLFPARLPKLSPGMLHRAPCRASCHRGAESRSSRRRQGSCRAVAPCSRSQVQVACAGIGKPSIVMWSLGRGSSIPSKRGRFARGAMSTASPTWPVAASLRTRLSSTPTPAPGGWPTAWCYVSSRANSPGDTRASKRTSPAIAPPPCRGCASWSPGRAVWSDPPWSTI